MPYTAASPLTGAPQATAAQARALLLARGCEPARADALVTAYWGDAVVAGLDPVIVVAQGVLESSHPETRVPFGSWWAVQHENYAGIGVTGETASSRPAGALDWQIGPDGRMCVRGYSFGGVPAGVRAHVVHLRCYAAGDVPPAFLPFYTAASDPRLPAAVGAGYRGVARRLSDLDGRWAVPGVGYGSHIAAVAEAIRTTPAPTPQPAPQPVPQPGGSVPIAKPAVTIVKTTKMGGYSRGTRQQLMIVSHITGAKTLSDHGSLSWLSDPIPDSPSVNYLIARSGTIYEIVDPHGPAPWTNGIDYGDYPKGKRPNMANPLIAELTRQQINPNQWCITIEHEGTDGQSMTAAQWASTTALQTWLCYEFAITPDDIHLIGHNQIDDIDRHYCPGWTDGQWAALRASIAARLGGTVGGRVDLDSIPTETVKPFFNSKGETIVAINLGGIATSVLGVNIVELGVTVKNKAGEVWNRSIRAGKFLAWWKS